MVGVTTSVGVPSAAGVLSESSMAALDGTDTALLIAGCLLVDPLLDVATAAITTINNTTMDETIPIFFLLNVHLRSAAAFLVSSSSISPRLIVTLFLLDLGDLRRSKWLGVVSELNDELFASLFFGGGERGITSSVLFVMIVVEVVCYVD